MLRGALPSRTWLIRGKNITKPVSVCDTSYGQPISHSQRCLSVPRPISKQLSKNERLNLKVASLYEEEEFSKKTNISDPFMKNKQNLRDIIIFTNHISSCQTPHNVLRNIARNHLSSQHLGVILRKLDSFCNASHPMKLKNIQNIQNNVHFQTVCGKIGDDLDALDGRTVVDAFSCLHGLLPADSELVKSLEAKALLLTEQLDFCSLVKLHKVVKNQENTKNYAEIVQKSQDAITRYPVSSLNERELVSLFYWMERNSSININVNKLTERALDLCETMNIHQLRGVVFFLANQGQRNTTLLRAIGHCMSQQSFLVLNIDHLCNLIYLFAKLSYCEENMMMLISSCIISKADTAVKPATLVQIMRSISMLQWRQEELIDTVISEAINVGASPSDISNMMISAAQLNYAPPQLGQTVNSLPDTSSTSPVQHLNTVWAAACLNLATSDMISSVLEPAFIQSLQGSDSSLPVLSHLRLLNLNAYASYDLEGYTGPTLPSEFISKPIKIPLKKKRETHSSVAKALSNVAPREKYWSQDEATPYGYNVDFELILNPQGDPCPKADYQHDEALPEGYTRLGIKVLEYSDMTLCNIQRTGLHSMAVRHLTKAGYRILQVSYAELQNRKKLVEQVKYLQAAIKTIINK